MQCLSKKQVQWWHFVSATLLVSAFSVIETNATDIAFNLFKNRDVLATRTMPDLSALSFGHFGEHKNEYFGKLQTAWEQLNFDRSYISRGNYYFGCPCLVWNAKVIYFQMIFYYDMKRTSDVWMTQLKFLWIHFTSPGEFSDRKWLLCRKLSYTCIKPVLWKKYNVHIAE